MAEITAALVKQLREMTDAGFMECKKALVEAEGDLDKAVDVLRTRGLAQAAKKAGRATNEGTIACYVSEDMNRAALVELQCETDFVGTNATFVSFAESLAKLAADNKPADVEAFKAVEGNGVSVADQLVEKIHTIGENMNLNRIQVVEVEGTGAVSSYVHMGGKIAILVCFAFANEATKASDTFKTFARDVAMQVAAANPVSARREDVPQDIVEHELEIYRAQAAQSGKPAEIQEKMAQGRIEKFYKQSVLTEQEFIKNGDLTIAQLTQQVSKELGDNIEICSFVRFELGEDAEDVE